MSQHTTQTAAVPSACEAQICDLHVIAKVAALLKQAMDHHRWQQLNQAECLATEAFNLANEKLGEKHVTTAYARTDLAIVQEDMGQTVEARDNLIAALEILEPALGHHHGQVTMIFTRLHHLFM